MEAPLIRLTTKHFLTGIASDAHAISGGIFYKADGIMPLNSPGGTEPTDNGLLRAGPAQSDITGSVVVDIPIAKAKDYTSGGSGFIYMLGSSGHFYKVDPVLDTVTDLRPGSPAPISNSANGMAMFQAKGGTKYLYYTQKTQIGRFDLSTMFVDNWDTGLDSTTQHPMHRYFDKILYGNFAKVGVISDNGSGDASNSKDALDIPSDSIVTAISDDGTYAAIAITNNVQSASVFSNCKILFWDGFSSSWLREYPIDDQFIVSLTRVGNSIIAQGQYGIYQVSFGGGVKKVLSRFVGCNASTNRQMGPGMAGTYGQSGFVFGQSASSQDASGVHMLGRISDNTPSAHLKPIIPTSGNVTLIESQAIAGKVYVATDTPKLYVYLFSSTTSGLTNVFLQTVYLPIGKKVKINRIDLVFGEPLAVGDSVSVQIKTDEDTALISGQQAAISYDATKTTRRASTDFNIECEEQFAIYITFISGVVKIKAIEVFADDEDPNDS